MHELTCHHSDTFPHAPLYTIILYSYHHIIAKGSIMTRLLLPLLFILSSSCGPLEELTKSESEEEESEENSIDEDATVLNLEDEFFYWERCNGRKTFIEKTYNLNDEVVIEARCKLEGTTYTEEIYQREFYQDTLHPLRLTSRRETTYNDHNQPVTHKVWERSDLANPDVETLVDDISFEYSPSNQLAKVIEIRGENSSTTTNFDERERKHRTDHTFTQGEVESQFYETCEYSTEKWFPYTCTTYEDGEATQKEIHDGTTYKREELIAGKWVNVFDRALMNNGQLPMPTTQTETEYDSEGNPTGIRNLKCSDEGDTFNCKEEIFNSSAELCYSTDEAIRKIPIYYEQGGEKLKIYPYNIQSTSYNDGQLKKN